jgi:hypothetical protein
VVDGDILDLNLRISQPNVHDLRSDGTLTGFGLSCNSPEASSSIVSQVNILQFYATPIQLFSMSQLLILPPFRFSCRWIVQN